MDAAINAQTRNRLIAMLPPEELARLDDALDVVPLNLRQIIAEPGKPFSHVYFPLSGIISLVIEMSDGDVIE